MSLSDNIIKARSTKLHENVIHAFKVKQFIKELKESEFLNGGMLGLINEKAGEGLI